MDGAMFAVASQQTLSLFITEGENFCLDEGRCFSTDNTSYSLQLVLEQAAVVCCLALVTCECHWLCKLYNTVVGTGRDGPLQQLSSLPLLLRCHIVHGDRCLKDYGFRLSQARVDSAESAPTSPSLEVTLS
eukprot:Em0001g3203a